MPRRRLSLLALTVALLGGCAAESYLDPQGPRFGGPRTVPPPAEHGGTRVATFNIEFGLRVEEAVAQLESESLADVDVLLLQEVDADDARFIAARLGAAWVYYPASVHQAGDFGNAVLSRWPILEDHKVLLPHPAPFDGRRRIAVSALVDGPEGPFFVVCVHNETVLLPLGHRLEQVQAVIDDAERAYADTPGVIAGDFNTFEPFAVRRTEALHEAHGYRRAAPAQGERTASTALGDATLDLVFARGLVSVGGGVGPPSDASDHRLVWAEFHRVQD